MARRHRVPAVLSVLALMSAAPAGLQASRPPSGGVLEVLVDGLASPEYHAGGTRYVEAVRGRAYALCLHNPFDVRVAVALSVDGLNTIDARHTTASAARKWVIGPHQAITISGWQTSMAHARRFFFTTEDRSYAGRLGRPDDMGVITAVFFKERPPARVVPIAQGQPGGEARGRSPAAADARADAAARQGAGEAARAAASSDARDEFAATGIGERTDHPVSVVHLDLEDRAATSIEIRYEYREQLVRLGVVPGVPTHEDPLRRRQGAHGFDKGFCPDIR